MPFISKKIALGLNSTASALTDEQFETLPYNAFVQIGLMTDAAGVLATVYSGSDLLQDEGPVPIALINVAPVYPDNYLLSDVAAAGERLKIKLRDTSGANRIVMVGVMITPIG